jgi:uncharacterized repeat protein (TIGR01451 family)
VEKETNASETSSATGKQGVSQTHNPADSQTGAATQTYTARFTGFVILFGVLTSAAIATFNPAAIAASGLLFTFLAASIAQTPHTPSDHLTVTYDISPANPRPADTVTVTAAVKNAGSAVFTDLRLIDQVPDELRVIDGSPRAAGPLKPGSELTISYTVIARRGTFKFGPVATRTRTHIGSMWTNQALSPETQCGFRCAVKADDIPIDDRSSYRLGELLSDSGGEGVEFYSTREYHRGDSPTRMNWRELAKRGELSTITFREHKSADITLIADARSLNRVSAGPGAPPAASLAAYATYQLTTALTNAGHRVSVTVPGLVPRESRRDTAAFPYRLLEPRRSQEQQRLVFNLLEEIETTIHNETSDADAVAPRREPGSGGFTPSTDAETTFDVEPFPVSTGKFAHDLSAWASPETQFLFMTPLLDAGAHSLCVHLQTMGFPVIVISPDATTTTDPNSTSGSLPMRTLRLQRATRVESLRRRGLTVIDWGPTKSLSECCEAQTPRGV